MAPQDYDSALRRIESGREDGGTEEQVRRFRGSVQTQWSHGLFGTGEEAEIIPYDAESSDIVFDGLYHNGDTQAVVELNNQYRESDLFDSDTMVSAEYTGDGWEFHELENYELGDQLPGHQ
jgi:hypothetical protein